MFQQSFHRLSDEFNTFSVQGAEENTVGETQAPVTAAAVA